MAQRVKNPPVNAGDVSLIPGLGRSPGEGNGDPLQYSWLGNPMDRLLPMASQRVRHHLLTKQHKTTSCDHMLLNSKRP